MDEEEKEYYDNPRYNEIPLSPGKLQIPLHRRIAEELSLKVTNGELKPGSKLPSERSIAQQYQASRATVRTALQHLESQGLISRRNRRSAIVSIRQNIAPHLRLACSHPHLVNIMQILGDMQLLPPRCRIELFDLQQPGSAAQLVRQPSCQADVLICDIKYANCIDGHSGITSPLQNSLPPSFEQDIALLSSFRTHQGYTAIPIAVSPDVLYYNRNIIHQARQELPPYPQWSQLTETAVKTTRNNVYGFQIRPLFSHMATLLTRMGGEMLQADGHIAANNPAFEPALKVLNDWLHIKKVTPLLSKTYQLNLFAQGRCAMAIDGISMFRHYYRKLGNDLGVTRLPGSPQGKAITNGFVAMALDCSDNSANNTLVNDFIRNLLSKHTQQVLMQLSAGLSVRKDLQEIAALTQTGIPEEAADIFLQQSQNQNITNLTTSHKHMNDIEQLLLELWLNLDNVDSICARFKKL